MEGNRRGVVLDRGPVEAIVAVRDALAQFDIDALTDRERLALVAELERLKGAVSAAQARAVHAVRIGREAAGPAREAVRSLGL
ncbi:hypothetical protein [Phycicoccus sp.]|uniref:hypothetical protein n=1 Tax=Phycicoccus sp. TaxID=1902410 RepID=UPI002CAD8CDE|nr:hypothetical protein [Phycicoccus sp.]HMM96421.1 hypothetical protein [Phycicoccus sp.]